VNKLNSVLELELHKDTNFTSSRKVIIPDQIEPPIPGQTEPGIPDEIEPLILG